MRAPLLYLWRRVVSSVPPLHVRTCLPRCAARWKHVRREEDPHEDWYEGVYSSRPVAGGDIHAWSLDSLSNPQVVEEGSKLSSRAPDRQRGQTDHPPQWHARLSPCCRREINSVGSVVESTTSEK